MSTKSLSGLRRILVASLLVLLAPFTAAQIKGFDAGVREDVVNRIGALLKSHYVFEDVAKECDARLQAQLAAGVFDEQANPRDFAASLTKELQSMSKDKHMVVHFQDLVPPKKDLEGPDSTQSRRQDRMRQQNYGFERVERLAGNVGYIDMRSFASPDLGRATAAAAMAFVANCDALVFDMRQNGGGSPGMVQLVCSYLFEEPTHLNSLYFREGNRTRDFWTLAAVPGVRMPDVPVFVLVSESTFSAAEEFAYNLRTQKRATIVGQSTRGGANPGRYINIVGRFGMFVPTGRAVNPVTRTNWEGVGVKPHIVVPAEDALERALVEARPAAEAYGKARIERRAQLRRRVVAGLRSAQQCYSDGRAEEGARVVETTLSAGYEGRGLDERRINMLGHEYLQAGGKDVAIAIFRFNTKAFASSSNAWDSLAVAYMESKETELAIENYRKSLELDPQNDIALRMLKMLESEKAGEEVGFTERSPDSGAQISAFVRRVFQDTSGNIWVGTHGDGVARYDGEALKYYPLNDSLGGVSVRAIVEDKNANLWFGTSAGLTKFDGKAFTHYTDKDGLVSSDVWSLAIDRNGIVWVGTPQGVSHFDGVAFTLFEIPEADPDPLRGVTGPRSVHSIMEDSRGRIWLGTNGGAYVYDGKSISIISEKDGLCNDSVNCIVEGNDGEYWFATHHNGVCRWDGSVFTHIAEDDGVEGTEVWDLFKDSSGNIWFPVEGFGVYRYDGRTFKNFSERQGLESHAIQCTYEDRDGRLWFGGWLGLYRLEGNRFVSVTKGGPWR